VQTSNWVLYVPYWKNGDPLNLKDEFAAAPILSNLKPETDWNKTSARGWIDGMWSTHWYSYFDGASNSDGSAHDQRARLPMLTAFDLLPASKNTDDKSEQAVAILRRGGRNLDLGPAILSGELVILGEAGQTPIPCPMAVNGDKIAGDGTTIYQIVLPLDHSGIQITQDATE
jgi:hypothetical protein